MTNERDKMQAVIDILMSAGKDPSLNQEYARKRAAEMLRAQAQKIAFLQNKNELLGLKNSLATDVIRMLTVSPDMADRLLDRIEKLSNIGKDLMKEDARNE